MTFLGKPFACGLIVGTLFFGSGEAARAGTLANCILTEQKARILETISLRFIPKPEATFVARVRRTVLENPLVSTDKLLETLTAPELLPVVLQMRDEMRIIMDTAKANRNEGARVYGKTVDLVLARNEQFIAQWDRLLADPEPKYLKVLELSVKYATWASGHYFSQAPNFYVPGGLADHHLESTFQIAGKALPNEVLVPTFQVQGAPELSRGIAFGVNYLGLLKPGSTRRGDNGLINAMLYLDHDTLHAHGRFYLLGRTSQTRGIDHWLSVGQTYSQWELYLESIPETERPTAEDKWIDLAREFPEFEMTPEGFLAKHPDSKRDPERNHVFKFFRTLLKP